MQSKVFGIELGRKLKNFWIMKHLIRSFFDFLVVYRTDDKNYSTEYAHGTLQTMSEKTVVVGTYGRFIKINDM